MTLLVTTQEQNLVKLAHKSGYSMTTCRKWWQRGRVLRRTEHALNRAANALRIKRPAKGSITTNTKG